MSEGQEGQAPKGAGFFVERATDNLSEQRRMEKAGAMGSCISAILSHINGTVVSANKWCDNSRLRYNLQPLDMPQLCDGCQAPMSVEHALLCKCGGLVHIRHDDVADEWHHLCGTATTFGRVTREPRIYSSVSHQVTVAGNDTTNDATTATMENSAN